MSRDFKVDNLDANSINGIDIKAHGSILLYTEGSQFPIPTIDIVGSFFQHDVNGLYMCVDKTNPQWKQVGL
jgi:hypothetical protein